MHLLPYVVAYLTIAVFIVAVASRILKWSRMPLAMRWELYPVPHEPGRAHYGGSYLEQTDWWKKPRKTSLAGEMKVMVPEILFLAALREHNRRLWRSSFPFHFGLYLVVGATLLLAVWSVLGTLSPVAGSGSLGWVLRHLVALCGIVGLGLAILGALGLLHRRLRDPALKDYTAPADIFNLLFFIVVFGVALTHVVLVDLDFSKAQAFMRSMLTFEMAALQGTPFEVAFTSVTVILLGLLLAYIPLTHMSHFVGKYFSYHAIRWDDEPNIRGGAQEEKIRQNLEYPVSWAAEHIGGGGKKTWAELATEDLTEETKK